MKRFNKKKPTGMFVQPLMDYNPDEWAAMLYAWPEDFVAGDPLITGFVFKTKDYAKEFFNLLRSYNDGESIDDKDNIKLSFITEDPDNYSVYVYPSENRENVNEFAEKIKIEHGNESQHIVASLTICRFFPYDENSSFKGFKEKYTDGTKIIINPYILRNGELEKVEGVEPIYKNHIKIKHRKLLEKNEHEYQHMKEMKRHKR
ncbi:MAG TPA: hypothetical protein VK048_03690, partial [Atopostipes sp.]|nr:hypothetical protein [Atopostipes sp.]